MNTNTRWLLMLGAFGGLSALVWWLTPKNKAMLGDKHLIDQSTRFYVKKYGLDVEDARRLVTSPRREKIVREIEDWRAQYGYPESNSPLSRGYARDKIRALAGSGLRIGQHYDYFGQTYEVIKIGRDRAKTLVLGRRVSDEFGKESLIDEKSFSAGELARRNFRALDGALAGMFYVPDGRAKGRHPSEFDPVQLKRGTRVELEHTTNRRLARQIAMDHLVEDPRYYTKLARVHLDGPSMLKLIASESRSPEEYARRAEAWASSEAKPPSIATIAKHWPRAGRDRVPSLVRRARSMRIAQTDARWRGYIAEPEES